MEDGQGLVEAPRLLPLAHGVRRAAGGEQQRAQQEMRGRVLRVRGQGALEHDERLRRGSGRRNAWTASRRPRSRRGPSRPASRGRTRGSRRPRDGPGARPRPARSAGRRRPDSAGRGGRGRRRRARPPCIRRPGPARGPDPRPGDPRARRRRRPGARPRSAGSDDVGSTARQCAQAPRRPRPCARRGGAARPRARPRAPRRAHGRCASRTRASARRDVPGARVGLGQLEQRGRAETAEVMRGFELRARLAVLARAPSWARPEVVLDLGVGGVARAAPSPAAPPPPRTARDRRRGGRAALSRPRLSGNRLRPSAYVSHAARRLPLSSWSAPDLEQVALAAPVGRRQRARGLRPEPDLRRGQHVELVLGVGEEHAAGAVAHLDRVARGLGQPGERALHGLGGGDGERLRAHDRACRPSRRASRRAPAPSR